MNWRIGRAWLWCLVFLIGALPAARAHAAGSVKITPPDGWVSSAHADQSALVRANSWSERSKMNLVQLVATSDRDDFVETAALLSADEPLSMAALVGAEAALARLAPIAAHLILSDVPPLRSGFAPAGLHPQPVFTATYEVGEIAYQVASIPAGPKHAVLLVAYKKSESSLYAPQFENLLSGLEGVATPVLPFPRKLWRWGTVIGWLLLGALSFLVALLAADRRGDYRTAGERALIAMGVLIAFVMVGVWWALGRDEAAVLAAGTTASSVALEVAIVGAVVGALIWVMTRVLGRELKIQSAPQGGTFAGRNTVLQRPQDMDPLESSALANQLDLDTGSESRSPSSAENRRRPTLHWGGVGGDCLPRRRRAPKMSTIRRNRGRHRLDLLRVRPAESPSY